MNRLAEVFEGVLSAPHISNVSKAHEIWFGDLLHSKGFNEKTLKEVGLVTKDVKDRISKSDQTLWFIPEPLGSQNTPDFLVSDENGNLRYIELKSSKQDKITWNGGYPKDNFIYVFSTERHKAQTIFMGDTCWAGKNKQILLEYAKEEKKRAKELNKLLETGQSYYPRSMFNDNVKYYGRDNRWHYAGLVFDFIGAKKPEVA